MRSAGDFGTSSDFVPKEGLMMLLSSTTPQRLYLMQLGTSTFPTTPQPTPGSAGCYLNASSEKLRNKYSLLPLTYTAAVRLRVFAKKGEDCLTDHVPRYPREAEKLPERLPSLDWVPSKVIEMTRVGVLDGRGIGRRATIWQVCSPRCGTPNARKTNNSSDGQA